MIFKKLTQITCKIISRILIFSGLILFISFFIAFTDLPFWAYHSLGTKNAKLNQTPEYIIQMSGSGMPSANGLIRTFYTSELAKKFSSAKIIIAFPNNSENKQQTNSFKNELLNRGIDTLRLFFEPSGINTYTQAKNISLNLLANKKDAQLLIVTSPEHLYRTVKTFKKLGFQNVGGKASFGNNLTTDKLINAKYKEVKYQNLNLRYNFWNYLKLEITVAREYCAITYYKLKRWI